MGLELGPSQLELKLVLQYFLRVSESQAFPLSHYYANVHTLSLTIANTHTHTLLSLLLAR